MKYSVSYSKKANKELKKLDSPVQKRLYGWIKKHLEGCEDPRAYGIALVGNLKGYWRYSIGDYRLIADIQDDKIIIIITEVGHRSEIYKEK